MRLTLASVSMIAAFLASATASKAADYTIDPTHSHVLFTIDHLGFAKMVGLFSDFSGNISFDANNVPASKLNVTIKTDSLQTQFAPRDKDLKGADWFNVTEFPEMTFVGTELVNKDDHTETITGKLTLHRVTKAGYAQCVVNKVGQNPARQRWLGRFFHPRHFQTFEFRHENLFGCDRGQRGPLIEIEAKKKS